MRAIDAVRRSGVAVTVDQTVYEAAAVMERSGVGALAVLDGDRLAGVVTDRDLVRRALARKVPHEARVDAVMSSPPVTIDGEADVHEAFASLRAHGIRRLAVLRDGSFAGMLTVDDLLIDLAADLADLARPVSLEVLFAHRDSPVPAVG